MGSDSFLKYSNNYEKESISLFGSDPRLVENRILDQIPDDIMIEKQVSTDKYMRLKLTPMPNQTIINTIEHYFGVETTVYSTEDNSSCILEIGLPLFDIICIRDTSRFPRLNGWILDVRHNKPGGSESIAMLKYDEDHPYTLQLAEHLIYYFNEHRDEMRNAKYKEIYPIRL